MTAICKENPTSIDITGLGRPVIQSTECSPAPLDRATRLAHRMLECARPHHESLLGYAMACSEWRLHGFHQCTGPVFDEVNALRASWWLDGLGTPSTAQSLQTLKWCLGIR
jgi:hypothetical protein